VSNAAQHRIVILGAAESGVGSAILAQAKGFDVFVSDKGIIAEQYKAKLTAHNIAFEEGKHSTELILNASEVIKSPGIPDKAPLIKELHSKGIPVISEIEFAARYTNATLVAITGTNGKSTTTMLTYETLRKAGLNVGLGGNIGKSFAEQVATENFDYYVLELSSFQLDGMFKTRVHIAVLLNITPDHLDRYEYNVDNYAASKFRVVQNQTAEDYFIFCADDELTQQYIQRANIAAKQLGFSITEKASGAYIENNNLIINHPTTETIMPLSELNLKGKHNVYNSMAAGIAARVLDIRKEVVRESFMDFQSIEHRMEFVAKVHGIEYINDSKATNINSTWYALESMVTPTILILGGVDKGNDYTMIKDLVREKVTGIVCLGVDNQKILDAFADLNIPMEEATSATAAVKAAYRMAKKGETVLLSPACASFDLFANYEDRGRQFKMAVREL
jgi:UDP-N-acetylmuramoylalanine--D-glutamate ligase